MSNYCKVSGVSQVVGRLKAYAEGLSHQARAAAQEIALTLQHYAQANHPWKMDTGATDLSTLGEVSEDLSAHVYTIVLSAGMDYDVFLELAHGGKWAWIWPAVLANEQKIREILERHLRNVSVTRA